MGASGFAEQVDLVARFREMPGSAAVLWHESAQRILFAGSLGEDTPSARHHVARAIGILGFGFVLVWFAYALDPPAKALDHDDVIQHGSFDHYFFWRQEIVDHFVRCGWVEATKASVLGAAFDLDLHRKLSHITAKDIDVLFIGSMNPRRQHFMHLVRQ